MRSIRVMAAACSSRRAMVNGDGKAEIVASQGSGTVRWCASSMPPTVRFLAQSVVFNGTAVNGLHVAVSDPNSNGRDEVLVGAVTATTKVRVLNGATLAEISEFSAYDPTFQGGVFVG